MRRTITFHFVALAWVVFQAGSVTTAGAVLRGLVAGDPLAHAFRVGAVALVVLGVVIHALSLRHELPALWACLPRPAQGAVWLRHRPRGTLQCTIEPVRLREAGRGASFVDGVVLPGLAEWAAWPRAPNDAGVVVFGDLLAACPGGVRVAALVEHELRTGGIGARVGEAVHRAFRPLQFYYLLDEVLAGAPRAVVFEVNPRALAPGFVSNAGSRFRNLSRKLSLARVLRRSMRPTRGAISSWACSGPWRRSSMREGLSSWCTSRLSTWRCWRLGLGDELGLRAHVAAMRTGMGIEEEDWLDLHEAGPARVFRDDANHLEAPGCELLAAAVAAHLALRLR